MSVQVTRVNTYVARVENKSASSIFMEQLPRSCFFSGFLFRLFFFPTLCLLSVLSLLLSSFRPVFSVIPW